MNEVGGSFKILTNHFMEVFAFWAFLGREQKTDMWILDQSLKAPL